MISFWEYKKQSTYELPDPIAILFLGVILPIFLMCIAIMLAFGYADQLNEITVFNYLNEPSILTTDLFDVAFFFTVLLLYGFSESILLATLLIRNRTRDPHNEPFEPILFFMLLGIHAILVICLGLYSKSPWFGVVAVIVMWCGWHEKFWNKFNFWIHPSFWAMQISIVTSEHLLLRSELPQWLNGLFFLLFSSAIIRWAYQKRDGNVTQASE